MIYIFYLFVQVLTVNSLSPQYGEHLNDYHLKHYQVTHLSSFFRLFFF